VLVALLARLVLDERLSPIRLAALGVGTAGGVLLIVGSRGSAASFGVGAGLALGAGLSYATYIVLTKRAAGRGSRPAALASTTFLVATIVIAPVLVLQPGVTGALWRSAWPFLLYLGVVPTAGAYALYTTGLRLTGAAPAAVAGLLEPLAATLLGIALFGERLTTAGWIGAALLLAAIAILAGIPKER
jgi:DME family drug/metabolite transporter